LDRKLQPMRKTRVLFIRFSSIGDILLTAPAVVAMRKALDGPFEIHFLTKSSMRPVLAGFRELVDVVHTIDKSTQEVLPSLRAVAFDHIIDLHNNLRSRRVKRSLDGISFTVDKQNLAKWLLVRGWRTKPIPHIVDRYFEAFSSAFGAELPSQWPKLFHGSALPEGLAWRLDDGARQSVPARVALALGATHDGKKIPAESFRQILQALLPHNITMILLGGANEKSLGHNLATLDDERILNLAGRTTISESAAILRESIVAVAGDTGMMHLAAAVGTPVIALWGCTRPSLGMSVWRPPNGSADLIPVDRNGAKPCSKLGNQCRFGGDLCIHHVDLEAVISNLLNQIAHAIPSHPKG